MVSNERIIHDLCEDILQFAYMYIFIRLYIVGGSWVSLFFSNHSVLVCVCFRAHTGMCRYEGMFVSLVCGVCTCMYVCVTMIVHVCVCLCVSICVCMCVVKQCRECVWSMC